MAKRVKKYEQITMDEVAAESKAIKVRSGLNKRPYGLCAAAGISVNRMSPREAWETWNNFRKESKEKKKPKIAIKPPARKPQRASIAAGSAATSEHKTETIKSTASGVSVPELDPKLVSQANSNSQFDRGSNSEREYKDYVKRIMSMDISESKKQTLLQELAKRWNKLLQYQAVWVPWTVAGRANYNARKLDKGDQVMKTYSEISEWFEGVEKSVKRSHSQYEETSARDAARAVEWVERVVNEEVIRRPSPTYIASQIMRIAPHDPKLFMEVYEKYDAEYHFKKNTNAAKLYAQTKSGQYTGAKKPQKLHESENLNTYKKTIQAGERVFMKFTTRPKPQLVFALKRRGWHWNGNEGAWSIPTDKYDAEFVAGIDENYKKYL